MCGEVGVTQQYSQVRWDSFAVEVLGSLYSTAPVSMHCNQSDARSFPVSPSPTSSQQLGTLLKSFCLFIIPVLLPRETGTSSPCRWSPPPWTNPTTPVRPEAPPADPLSPPLSEGHLGDFSSFSLRTTVLSHLKIVCAY